jgi:chitinase
MKPGRQTAKICARALALLIFTAACAKSEPPPPHSTPAPATYATTQQSTSTDPTPQTTTTATSPATTAPPTTGQTATTSPTTTTPTPTTTTPKATTKSTTTTTTQNTLPPSQPPAADKIISGYYAGWAAYSGYTPLDIPAGRLTNVIYAFAKIGDDLKIAMGDPQIDPANFAKLGELKKLYPHIKISISIGGWDYSDKFSDAALTDARRTAFADSVVDFIKRYGFDGVDIDWEYPVSGGMSGNSARPGDKTNFTLLMQKLREKLNARGVADGRAYLLSFAGGAGSHYISNTELAKLSQTVDFATIMTYDLHGLWDSSTDLNAPLFTPSEPSPQYKISANSAVKAWTSAGFPPSKLVLGVPFYGHIYYGVTGGSNGLYGRFTGGGAVTYNKILSAYLNAPGYVRYRHADAKVPWLFNGSVFISYDDKQSVAAKAKYALQTGLAGACVWELSQDKSGALINALADNLQ